MKTSKKMTNILLIFLLFISFQGKSGAVDQPEALAIGSVIELNYSDLGIADPDTKFDVYLKLENCKAIKFNVIKPASSDVFYAEFAGKVLLYNKRELRKRQLGSFLKSNPIDPMVFNELYVKGNAVNNGQELEIDKRTELVPPEITSVTGSFAEGELITFTGYHFSDIPTVYVEVQRGLSFVYKKVRIDNSSFRYMDATGTPNSSCMKVLATDSVDDKPVGYSEVSVRFPKITYTREAATGYFIIDNKLGMDSCMFLRELLIDDFSGPVYDTTIDPAEDRVWYFTRIATDDGIVSSGKGDNTLLWKFVSAVIGEGICSLAVQKGGHFIGVWIALNNVLYADRQLNLGQLLGPYVKAEYQPEIWGVKSDIKLGIKRFKMELKELSSAANDKERKKLQKRVKLRKGEVAVYMGIPLEKRAIDVRTLDLLVEGKGNASIDRVSFLYSIPSYSSVAEQVFLYTFGHLSQCWDPANGLVADRAKYPAVNFAAAQSMGTFALISAAAADLGYVSDEDARTIIAKIKELILDQWPSHNGLLVHFAQKKEGLLIPAENSEYSSIDTVICLVNLIFACHATGIDYSDIQKRLSTGIDWDAIFDSGKGQIRHGYNYDKTVITSTWDVWSSEVFLLYLAYVAATGKTDFSLTYSTPPTWNGSGFNDGMAQLFFDMSGTDIWGNSWPVYLTQSFATQKDYLSTKIGINALYTLLKLLGISACEVPVFWNNYPEVSGFFSNNYASWGMGGRNLNALPYCDGTAVVGYPILAPHYTALFAAEHPEEFENVFTILTDNYNVFSPLNNVESFGFDQTGNLQWNSLKGSWNLSLQALGTARLLSKEKGKVYLPYRIIGEIEILNKAYRIMMPQTNR